MYYTIYKVTNQINGKIYVGAHMTKDLNDNYMGSGKYLKRSQEKHGIENFTKDILFIYDNPEEMFAKEAEIVNEDFLAEENTYNLKLGGFGGFDHLNNENYDNPTHSKDHMVRMNSIRIEKYPNGTTYGKTMPEGFNLPATKARLKKYPNGTFKGKNHTDETKKKIGEITSKAQSGEGNSQYGTRWIHSVTEKRSKKIKKVDPLPEDWLEGRKIKFGE